VIVSDEDHSDVRAREINKLENGILALAGKLDMKIIKNTIGSVGREAVQNFVAVEKTLRK
jgi:hypothetical protein